jgi:hypothetical protein
MLFNKIIEKRLCKVLKIQNMGVYLQYQKQTTWKN